jgi:hypothetical protein
MLHIHSSRCDCCGHACVADVDDFCEGEEADKASCQWESAAWTCLTWDMENMGRKAFEARVTLLTFVRQKAAGHLLALQMLGFGVKCS